MTQVDTLAAEMRDRGGKGTARAARRQNKVPAVIYGDKQAPLMVNLDHNSLLRYVNKAGFLTHLFDLEISGKKHRVLPRDVQFDAVTDRPLHVDFLRVSANTKVRVAVPVHFVNPEKSPGIKKGGTLNIVHHEIEVMCSPDSIPEAFSISLEGLEINDAVHLSALTIPAGVSLTTHEKDFTIATIAVPSAIRSEAQEAAAAAAAAEGAPAAEAAAPAAGAKAAPAAGAKAPAGDAKKDTKK
ncbi:MAG: 50S ribosomal protein L25/general stress protein Ctc [Proteobacteria bacterium]|nr:50S ribosomal protein L25/general stress protein Ctc [Pseudomonadota bacterium]